jgi:uncharacterized delta-60 repeat protein
MPLIEMVNKFLKIFFVTTFSILIFALFLTPHDISSEGNEPFLVKDINPSGWSYPTHLTAFGNILLFQAEDGVNGFELWRSDSTEEGTYMVKNINSGGSSSPGFFHVHQGIAYFEADDGIHGSELWRTDGTEQGTYMVKDINTVGWHDIRYLYGYDGIVYFQANDGVNGIELWRSDGTEQGTYMVKNINLTGSSSPKNFIAFNGEIFFAANDGVNGEELWKTDGTEEGTVMVKNINPTEMWGGSSYPEGLTELNGELIFVAEDGVHSTELWKTDGTEEGTVLLKDINVGGTWDGSYPSNLTKFNNEIYFSADNGTNGTELWKTDGTSGGTVMVKDINTGGSSSMPIGFTVLNSTLYFRANDGVNGYELWKTDGTSLGTVLVKNINSVDGSYPTNFQVSHEKLYFSAYNEEAVSVIWESDGTLEGTVQISEIESDRLRAVGTTLFFEGYELTYGKELWAYKQDYTAPAVDILGVPEDWQSTSAILTIDCTDDMSGCDVNSYGYRIESDSFLCDSSGEWLSYTDPLEIDNYGYVCVRAKDNAANGYSYSSVYEIKADTLPPVCGVWEPSTPSWRTTPQLFTLSGSTDEGSGLVGIGVNSEYLEGPNNTVNTLGVQEDGKILIGGAFTTYEGVSRERIARLNEDGSLDSTFDSVSAFNNPVNKILIESEGKILVVGNFTTYDGVSRERIARLNEDGTLDTSFDSSNGANGNINGVAIQQDGKIIIGGTFTTYAGISREGVTRLNSDGTIDTSFNPGVLGAGSVYDLEIQEDGKIIVVGGEVGGGWIGGGESSGYVTRLNSDGSLDTSFSDSEINNIVETVQIQGDGKVFVGGEFVSYAGEDRQRVARLNDDGSLDVSFDSSNGATQGWATSVKFIEILDNGKIIIAGDFKSYAGNDKGNIARLNIDGSLDENFYSSSNPVAYVESIYSLAILDTGKIIIVGSFLSHNSVGRQRIARLNSNGFLDSSFTPNIGSTVKTRAIKIQNDGKILVAGSSGSYNERVYNGIFRLNVDGRLDTTFNSSAGANQVIRTIALQDDGKIIIGGDFDTYAGQTRYAIARLNTDGSLDESFDTSGGFTSGASVYDVALQDDGKVIVVGSYVSYSGETRQRILRLNTDGSLDLTFDTSTGANNVINSVAVLDDDKIIIAGQFTSYKGVTRQRIARLNSDGSLDSTFDSSNGASLSIADFSIQNDGKIVIVGYFDSYQGSARQYVARLNSDGSLDTGFDTSSGSNSFVYATDVDEEGNVYIGGNFDHYAGISRQKIAKLNNDGSLDTDFNTSSAANSDVYEIVINNNKILVGGEFTSYGGLNLRNLVELDYTGSLTPYDLINGGTCEVSVNGGTCTVEIEDNVGNVSVCTSPQAKIDTTAPTGTVVINGGASSTTTRSVSLVISATDVGSGVSHMTICNNSSFSGCSWEVYATTKSWQLTEGDGTKTVYARFRDNVDLVSSTVSDTIQLTSPPPPSQPPPASTPPPETSSPPPTTTRTTPPSTVKTEEKEEVVEEESTEREEVEEKVVFERPVVRDYTLTVVDKNGKPVKGALVTLENGSQGYTDDSGVVRFTGISEGRQSLTISYDGYEMQKEINVMGEQESIYDTVDLDIEVQDSMSGILRISLYVFIAILFLLLSIYLLNKSRKKVVNNEF